MVAVSTFRDALFSLCLFAVLLLFMLLVYLPTSYPTSGIKKSLDVNVEGWEANVSRWLPDYIQPGNKTAILSPSDVCSDNSFHVLLIVVCSAITNVFQRATIRDTWGNMSASTSETPYKIVFLVGLTNNSTLQENIEEEALIYNDIIQENFVDTYNNLTLKSVMLLKFINMNCINRVEFILKCDDDMFIHVPNLLNLIQSIARMKVRHILIGELICDAKPITDVNSKWYSPSYMFHGKVYPRYLSGTGYLMNVEVARKLYEASLVTPFFHLEDVYITGLCAKKSGIKPRDHVGFSYETRPLDPCLYLRSNGYHRIITSHRVTPAHLVKLWTAISNHQTQALNCTQTVSKSLFSYGTLNFRKNAKTRCL